jgi:hypothetical protein
MIWRLLLVLLRVWALLCTRVTIVSPDEARKPYLVRWHIWPGVYLHKFVSSDPDRGWHCHPWTWARSRIMAGTYYQSAPDWPRNWPGSAREGWFRAGDVNELREGDYHRLLLVTRVVWTLFSHGPKHGGSWNFLSYDQTTITAPREVDAPQVRRGLVHFA